MELERLRRREGLRRKRGDAGEEGKSREVGGLGVGGTCLGGHHIVEKRSDAEDIDYGSSSSSYFGRLCQNKENH
jgi:hypothetical protein